MYRKWYDYYSPGVPTTISHSFQPQRDYFLHWAEVQPEKPYLIHGDRVVSYAETNIQARRLANALIQLGYQKQDRIAIIGPNIPEFVIAEQACFKLGAIIVPLNPYYTIHELKKKLTDSGTSIVIVTSASAGKIIDLMHEGQTDIKHIIVIESKHDYISLDQGEHIYNYKTIIENSTDTEPSIQISPDDICILIYTGGTTGISKGVPLSVFNVERMSWVTWYWYNVPLRPTKEHFRSLVALPLYHIYGFNSQVSLNLVDGGTLILVDSPKTDALLDAINRFRPNVFFAVPAMIHGLINHPDTTQSAVRNCLKGVNCGGSALAHETLQKWEELTGLSIVEGYGMTETNIITENPYGHTKQDTVGIPVPDTDVRIVDIKTGTKILGPGEVGELIAKGPQMMKAYWNNPEETANTVRNGWIYTGDIATMDEEGYVTILDRKKDLIICSGFNVFPREIDEILYRHPKIKDACTIGVPDPKRGETVKAFVVVKDGAVLTKEEVINFCREYLTPYKVPKLVEFIDDLPRTSVGKPMRTVLRKYHQQTHLPN